EVARIRAGEGDGGDGQSAGSVISQSDSLGGTGGVGGLAGEGEASRLQAHGRSRSGGVGDARVHSEEGCGSALVVVLGRDPVGREHNAFGVDADFVFRAGQAGKSSTACGHLGGGGGQNRVGS